MPGVNCPAMIDFEIPLASGTESSKCLDYRKQCLSALCTATNYPLNS
jgi:hypothetical protein